MPDTIGTTYASPDQLGDDFTSYAINELYKQNLEIDDSAVKSLTTLINKGTKRIKLSSTSEPLVYKSIDRLVTAIVTRKNEEIELTTVSDLDIEKVLKSICPVWPFC
ncbi:hypothetical protein [Solitalea canadensis]|uniref:Uncharacterized protein n=1 Tax=Solitalea canadensis (strain ATCC 29591 / DSM 3403 / JCM 21819 / LMG 8368 / NBRC 15130 / NCIMB 12057 / USAM 9D) TaxID=929556 RepID=H8KP82_SOLCM|nr:hypothetical protein [Solitalea canadensis]AFD05719.1 hypothetical protein Solca_0589 [Solitalea canadensis DSM 3403]